MSKNPHMPPPVRTPWRLTEEATQHMEALGVDAREVLAVLERPQVPPHVLSPGIMRRIGYGLRVDVQGARIVRVSVDGARSGNWEELALARARFGAGANVPVLLSDEDEVDETEVVERSQSVVAMGKATRRMPMQMLPPSAVKTGHVLDGVHVALRRSIVEQCEGDYTRLIVHSPTRVEILPK